MSRIFALVDCNSFYASCEKLFRPDLKYAPVVVLSNNDGCVVARSPEAKALGIGMAVPFHQVQGLIRRHGVAVFSSNYALYADISARVMSVLEEMAPAVEVYSIDEAFLDLTGVGQVCSLQSFGQQLRDRVRQWVGVTVGVGIAPSKTLAKLANHAAKHYPATGGVVDLSDPERQRRLLRLVPVGEVWGVGRQLNRQLQEMGVHTAADLADLSPQLARSRFSVVLERTVRELNGESCLSLEQQPEARRQIICSRSFGQRIEHFGAMKQAVCQYAARAAEKLREEGQYARVVSVFVRTSPFAPGEPFYTNTATAQLPVPDDDTRVIINRAVLLLRQIWREGHRFMKAGVMLSDFHAPGCYQPGLFDSPASQPKGEKLMQVLDQINRSGRGKVFFAGQGMSPEWSMKREHLSPSYTTRWEDIPCVR